MTEIGNVFNIEHFAIHDGPGIRTTVFMKGCPLSCFWCHNPEGLSVKSQTVHYPQKCDGCGRCIDVCPRGAIEMVPGTGIFIDQSKCIGCGECEDACLSNAMETVGRQKTMDQVVDEIVGDRLFYDESGGGVTFSGGEPMLQWQFVAACAKKAKEQGIHTAIETTAFTSRDALTVVAEHMDLFLLDLKHIDPIKHLEYTGVDNSRILENLRYLSEIGKEIIIRMVVIPTINDEEATLQGFSDFIASLSGTHLINLLPLHKSATEKYRRLDKKFMLNEIDVPDEAHMAKVADFYRARGHEVKIGG